MWWTMPEAGEQRAGDGKVRVLAVAGSLQQRQRTVLTLVPLHDVRPNPDQPRKIFDEEKLAELAASIKAHGLLQPIVVRRTSQGFEIVAGERRFRAAQLAGDVDALDELIGDDLLFAGPDGRLASKADDLAAYRNGTVRFELHEPAELSVRRLGDDVAVASLATLLRVRVNDEPVEAVHRYTRVWSRRDGRWRVVGGQVAPMPGSAAGPPDPGGDVEP